MAGADEVAADIQRGIQALPVELVGVAHQLLGEAYQILGPIAAGSSQPEMHHAAASLEHSQRELERAQAVFIAIHSAMQAVITALMGTGEAAPVITTRPAKITRPAEPNEPAAGAVKPGAETATDKRAAELLAKLPERINPGDKTSGYWIDEDCKEYGPLISGEDEDYKLALAELRRLRVGSPRGVMWAVAHVEIKFAVRLRGSDRKHLTLVINNRPCFQGRYSCDQLLPQVLRPDQQVTVYWPDGKRTYRGRKA